LLFNFSPETVFADWSEYFQPATYLLLQGKSHYLQEGFYNHPWILIPLIPFAQLSPKVGGYTSGRVRKAGRSG
jgi:hypothetical protein